MLAERDCYPLGYLFTMEFGLNIFIHIYIVIYKYTFYNIMELNKGIIGKRPFHGRFPIIPF